MNLRSLSDSDLLSTLQGLVKCERQVLTKILHHLREVESRKLYCTVGCSSLFDYAVKHLKYSEGQAGRRIQAMRLVKELPEVEQKIESGVLSLSNIAQAQSFFRDAVKENEAVARTAPFSRQEKLAVLSSLENKSQREGERELSKLAGSNVVPKEKERVISADVSEFRFPVNSELKAKLEEVRSLLGPRGASMSFTELVQEMAMISAQSLKEKKFGKKRAAGVAGERTAKPSSAKESAAGATPAQEFESVRKRAIPKSVQFAVWQRDQGLCSNCKTRRNLCFDHVIPFARGGKSALGNLRLLCFACNQRAGIEAFGMETIQRCHSLNVMHPETPAFHGQSEDSFRLKPTRVLRV